MMKFMFLMALLNVSRGFQLKNGNGITSYKILKIRNKLMIRYDSIDDKNDKDYYMGMITNNDIEASQQKDNLTPNLKLGGIFFGMLFGLIGVFIFINKDIAPPPY